MPCRDSLTSGQLEPQMNVPENHRNSTARASSGATVVDIAYGACRGGRLTGVLRSPVSRSQCGRPDLSDLRQTRRRGVTRAAPRHGDNVCMSKVAIRPLDDLAGMTRLVVCGRVGRPAPAPGICNATIYHYYTQTRLRLSFLPQNG